MRLLDETIKGIVFLLYGGSVWKSHFFQLSRWGIGHLSDIAIGIGDLNRIAQFIIGVLSLATIIVDSDSIKLSMKDFFESFRLL